METLSLQVKNLDQGEFSVFGDVIDTNGRSYHLINDGRCKRFDHLAELDLIEDNGRPRLSILRSDPSTLPLRIKMVERHPLSSQGFVPLSNRPFLIIVAAKQEPVHAENLHAFISNGKQGVNYHRGTWHHPLIALEETSEFLVIDRSGPGKNCDEIWLAPDREIIVSTL